MPHSARRLIVFLALSELPVRRAYAAATLWLDAPEVRSSGSLRTVLWRLRRPGHRLVELHGDCMSLSGDVVVDVRALTSLNRRMMCGGWMPDGMALDLLMGAGELLPGWYDEWLVMERERVRQLAVQTMERAAELLAGGGRPREAVRVALAAVDADPLGESAHRVAIGALTAVGNVAEAHRQYRRYADAMRRELQLEPSAELQRLMARAP